MMTKSYVLYVHKYTQDVTVSWSFFALSSFHNNYILPFLDNVKTAQQCIFYRIYRVSLNLLTRPPWSHEIDTPPGPMYL